MSRSKGKARKGKRTARQQPKAVVVAVEGVAAGRVQAPDEETSRVVVNPVAVASAEGFVANAELTPPPLFEDKDDMGDYLGEIFYARQQAAGNDIALDMETLQPVVSATLVPMTMARVEPGPQVRDLTAEFEDAPTLPEAGSHDGAGLAAELAAQLAAFEVEPPRAARVTGR
jgi:hypothetical protein